MFVLDAVIWYKDLDAGEGSAKSLLHIVTCPRLAIASPPSFLVASFISHRSVQQAVASIGTYTRKIYVFLCKS